MNLDEITAALAAGRLNRRHVTWALDAGGHYGPEVDLACLDEEPAVDEWEAGTSTPTAEQLVALAALVGCTPEFLLAEDDVGPGRVTVCQRSGKGRGCRVYDDGEMVSGPETRRQARKQAGRVSPSEPRIEP